MLPRKGPCEPWLYKLHGNKTAICMLKKVTHCDDNITFLKFQSVVTN